MVSRRLTLPSGPVDMLGRFFTPPLVTIDTGGAPIVDKETYVPGTVTISRTAFAHSGPVQIRGRGNSTWEMPKKPYKLKLGSAAALLGMPADREWVLLANYFDPTLVRTTTAFEMGRRTAGLAWTPRMRHVEVVLNGVFLGAYLLGEHVKVAPARIPIVPPGGTDTSGLALTGGYSMEIDQRAVIEWGEPGFRTAHDDISVTLDEPDGAVPEQAAYIEDWINDFEAVLYGPDWLDPESGYARLIDRDSFIAWYLVQELCRSIDSDFYSSCKLYKTRDTADTPGRLSLGPLWDFDLSLGIEWVEEWPTPTASPQGFYTLTGDPGHDGRGARWIARMLTDPAFTQAAWDRWQRLVARLTADPDPIDTVLDRQILALRDVSRRNRQLWGHEEDPAEQAGLIKAWLAARIDWMTTVLAP